jgi:hypothetical protein
MIIDIYITLWYLLMEWLIPCILPKSQVQAPQFPVHISYFLQNCKKGKSSEKRSALVERGWSINHQATATVSRAWL